MTGIAHPLIREPGIYFGLPEDQYHSSLALSASGIKWLRISSLDWWARSPLNPEHHDEETDAKIIGRAYHKRIIEGHDAFQEIYAPELDAAEYPNALRTNEEIRSAIIDAGGPVKGTAALRKAELVSMLLEYNPDALIWESLLRGHIETHRGKIMLSAPLIRRIEIAAAMIEHHPQLSKAFTGGMPEVSVFYTDSETGVPIKARVDYWKPRAVVDLKSFSNSNGLPVRKAIARAVANYRYHIQAKFYLDATDAAIGLIDQGRVFGDVDPHLLRAFHDASDRTFLHVWQQTGVAPVAKGMVLTGIIFDIAQLEIELAKTTFARCWETFGTEPWVDIGDIDTFDSSEFPAYISE